MKKTAVALLFVFAFSAPVFSQEWAIQAGPVFSRYMENEYPAPYYKRIRWQYGLMFGARLRVRNSLSLEFNFIQKGDRKTVSSFATGRETEIQNRLSFLETNCIWRIPLSKKRPNGWRFEPGIGLGVAIASRVCIHELGKSEMIFRDKGFNGTPISVQIGLAKPVGHCGEWFFRTSFSFYTGVIYEELFGISLGHSGGYGLFGHAAWATGLRYPVSPKKPAK